ncbi:MAG: two pore domain potassium channel family protein, partial [Chitinophagaceae bacterium]|nr:two pore domain potassium channel family protein [Chitinophagaceae bacterium]
MRRRGLKYVVLLTMIVIVEGASGMYAFENGAGLKSYGESLWWTAMLITSIGSEYWPQTGEGKALCFFLSVYGFCVFGYITATLASFFVGRDAEENDAPVASSDDIAQLRKEVERLTQAVNQLNK